VTHTIEVIGLGAADIEQLPLGIYRTLTRTDKPIFLRTGEHPVVESLAEEGVRFSTFDAYYEREDQFADVYEHIVQTLLKEGQNKSIIYVVPGHPMLAEQTVQLLLTQREVPINIVGGQSYLDALFTSLKIDPIEGFQFVDGTAFSRHDLQYRQHLVFCQVYDQFIASEIKLTLLEDLPADYKVVIIEAAGSSDEVKTIVPLHELDRTVELSNLTSVYVPPVPDELLNHQFSRLREIVAALRGPNGCPWDRKQTHETLRTYLIEEAYELIDAINEQDDEGIIEELGDVLLQVVLHSQIGEDSGYFAVEDVIDRVTRKMIHRHPHVFKRDSEDVKKSWDELKSEERGEQVTSVLDGISKSAPSLTQAFEIQKKVTRVGFQWEQIDGVWDKLQEEVQEVKEAIRAENDTNIEKELGDVLFVIANLALHLNINPEIALLRTNQKFTSRFQYIEEKLLETGQDIEQTSLVEMDGYWDEAKRKEVE